MSRIPFNPPGPNSHPLDKLYSTLDNISGVWVASSYIIPSGLQTPDYTRAILRASHLNPELAEERAAQVIEREEKIREARIRTSYFVGAAALQHVHYANRRIMLDQIDYIRDIVHDTDNLTAVGIVPDTVISPLPAGLPSGVSPLASKRDFQIIDADATRYITWDDGREICTSTSISGAHGIEAQMRLEEMNNFWLYQIQLGPEAIVELEMSKLALFSQSL